MAPDHYNMREGRKPFIKDSLGLVYLILFNFTVRFKQQMAYVTF